MRGVRGALRSLGLALGLATGIALLLTAVFPGSGAPLADLGSNWVYAFCIGGSIQLLATTGLRVLPRWAHRSAGAAGPAVTPEVASAPELRWAWFGPWLLLSSVVGYGLGGALADLLLGRRHIAALLSGDEQTGLFLGALTLLVSVLTSLVFIARSRADSAHARSQQAEREAAEHRLRLLESQLEPHMLFNTLANLRVLIAQDPQQAQAMLDRLIAFLRGTLGGSLARTHELEDEFARLADYLALMGVRMGDRLHSELHLPPELARQPVPPLLLQPLVENAIRHGLEPAVAGGRVWVRAEREGAHLKLTVGDTGVGWPADSSIAATGGAAAPPAGRTHGPPAGRGQGFGTEQVRQRLRTVHGPAASLSIGPGPDGLGTLATVRLPLAPVEDGQATPASPGP